MAPSLLHELLPAFNERNLVLTMLLGVTSLSDRWMDLLHAQGSAESSPESKVTSSSPPRGSDLSLMYFLLGTIHFSTKFQSLLESSYRAPIADHSGGEKPAWSELRSILR